ncbi:MAG: T9SS type A sorting domain-containing protein [Bacteroidia bacterium]|nr:T9SS type A sorting domain-containing protein [Bacteroidia bacterium]
MSKQAGYYMSAGVDYTFPYYHHFTYNYLNKSDSMALNYGYYDGSNWKVINTHIIVGQPMRLLMWGNRILGVGNIARLNGVNAPAQKYFGVMEYVGGKWNVIPGGTFDSTMQYIDAAGSTTDLYLRVATTSYAGTVYHYDTTTNKFVALFNYSNGDFVRTKLIAGKNRVVLTSVGMINNNVTYGFAYMEGDTFYRNTSSGYGVSDFYAIDRTNDHIYSMDFSQNRQIREFDSTTKTIRVTSGDMGSPYSPLHVYDGKVIWFSYNANNNKDVYYNILCPGDSIWKNLEFPQASGNGVTNPYCASNGVYTKIYKPNSSYHVELAEGAAMEGIAYIDKDSNCVVDSGEHRLKNYIVYGKATSFYASAKTDDTGHYRMYVIPDTVSMFGAGKLAACAGANTIPTQIGNAYWKNVPIMDPKGYDVGVKALVSIRTRWNSIDGYGAMIENKGYPVDSVNLTVLLDSKLNVGNMDSNFYSKSANQANGRIYNLDYFEKRWIRVSAWIDTANTKPDSVICHKVFVNIDSTEINYADNSDTTCQLVVYSYDPNSKICAQKQIKPLTISRLDYFIEFQNEGNDDAYDVVVEDPLSSKLNYETLKINGASHPYTFEFKNGKLVFTFKDIFLKPKKLNEAMSKGYIRFSINTMENLALGDSIENTAYIYFDLNKPVITNTSVVYVENNVSVNLVDYNSGIGLKLYPNPVFDILNIEVSGKDLIYIYNSIGQVVDILEPLEGSVALDVSSYESGVYFIRSGSYSAKFIRGNTN